MSDKQKEYAARLLKIASEQAHHKFPKGSKEELLIYQLGFVVGMLSRYAPNDITIHQDVRNLEEHLGIKIKE
jgi:hypothetical protein